MLEVMMNKKGKIAIFAVFIIVVLLLVSVAIGAPGGNRSKPVRECDDGIDNDGDTYIDWPNDPGCRNKNDDDESNCGDGVCEGEETPENCPEDCMIPDSCSDTDGGFDIFLQGTVSGYNLGNLYEHTDYCLNTTFLVEYYCFGDQYSYVHNNCDDTGNYTMQCITGECVYI
jgi:hypothetical protein